MTKVQLLRSRKKVFLCFYWQFLTKFLVVEDLCVAFSLARKSSKGCKNKLECRTLAMSAIGAILIIIYTFGLILAPIPPSSVIWWQCQNLSPFKVSRTIWLAHKTKLKHQDGQVGSKIGAFNSNFLSRLALSYFWDSRGSDSWETLA